MSVSLTHFIHYHPQGDAPAPLAGERISPNGVLPLNTAVSCSISPTSSVRSSCPVSPSPPAHGEYSSDIESASFPSSSELMNMPIPPSRGRLRNKSPNHVPRPRNAFMLFRSAFAAAQKISTSIEHDNRHITRIIAHCWNRLSDTEKQVWRNKATAEKAEHALKYPNYRFSPMGRVRKPLKRNVRRNGVQDKQRCEIVAELLLSGKHGAELEEAMRKIDTSISTRHRDYIRPDASQADEEPTPRCHPWQPLRGDFRNYEACPFRSPLLPPTKAESIPPEQPFFNNTPQAFSDVQTPSHHLPNAAVVSNPAPHTTFWDYCRVRDGTLSLPSTPPAHRYQSCLSDTGHDQPSPNLSTFSWGEGSFSSDSSSSSPLYL